MLLQRGHGHDHDHLWTCLWMKRIGRFSCWEVENSRGPIIEATWSTCQCVPNEIIRKRQILVENPRPKGDTPSATRPPKQHTRKTRSRFRQILPTMSRRFKIQQTCYLALNTATDCILFLVTHAAKFWGVDICLNLLSVFQMCYCLTSWYLDHVTYH